MAATGRARRAGVPGSSFSLPSQGTAKAALPLGIGALANLDALMSLQEVDDAPERRRRAALRGKSLLDSLDQLKAAMLAGKIPSAALHRIAEQLRQRVPSADPELDEILAHIELRAEVEIAKLGLRG